MIKISDIVHDILQSSNIELEAMRLGVLNLSAFAEKIHAQVEEKAWKSVKKTTIVVALARLQKKLALIPPLQPKVILDELSVKTPLADITFEKTRQTIEQSRSLSAFLAQHNPQFFTITQGINELTIVVSQEQLDLTLDYFDAQPKSLFKDLVGVTVKFSEKYIPEPNVIYAILSAVAAQRINITEVISTYTELTLIVNSAELDVIIKTLNQFFLKK
jgi:aspartokinase